MKINIGIRYSHPSAIAVKARYARIDNTNVPAWVNVAPNPVSSPAVLAQNIDNGQYQIELTPIYADGRICTSEITYTHSCAGLISINAFIQGNNIIVQYLAPSDVPKVRIVVDYPNNGQFDQTYVNNGNDISIPVPANQEGTFYVQGQSVCDEVTGFYSPSSNRVTVTKITAPSITQVDEQNTGTGGTRTQVFSIGSNVALGNRFVFTVYGHAVSVTAVSGDTPASIAIKVRDAINGTTNESWNDHGGAPSVGTVGFKPTATANGTQVVVVLDFQHSFSTSPYVS